MKKGKVFGKGQVILALMVLALGAAVWLNMKVSSNTKYLGEATYVSTEEGSADAVQTAAKADAQKESDAQADDDYFSQAEKQRTDALKAAKKDIAEMLDTDVLSDEEKKSLQEGLGAYAARLESAVNIENLLKAKGFNKAIAVIGNDSADIVVSSEGLTSAQTLQIQDIVTEQTEIPLAKIKIISVK